MTASLDFALRPPEVTSALMYMGDGSGSMLAAASAWKTLGAELRATALSYTSIMFVMADDEWHGPVSASMVASTTRYTTWMHTTALWAEQTAAQAEAAVAAYEAAFAATVPPAVVAANRGQLASLMASNFLGLNTPAIMATELQYCEMWTQDAEAMGNYAVSSAAATQLTPFTEPPQIVNQSGLTDQAAATANAAQTPSATWQPPPWLNWILTKWTDPEWLWENVGPTSMIWNNLAFFATSFGMPTTWTGLVGSGAAAVEEGAEDAATAAEAGTLGGMLAAPVESAARLGGIAATTGNATFVGKLAVPQSWTTAAPVTHAAVPVGTPMIRESPAGAAGMPGMPMGSTGRRSFGRTVPQYGFRPQFVARPPSAG